MPLVLGIISVLAVNNDARRDVKTTKKESKYFILSFLPDIAKLKLFAGEQIADLRVYLFAFIPAVCFISNFAGLIDDEC